MLPPDFLINEIEAITAMYNDFHTSLLKSIARHIADTLKATGAADIIPTTAYEIRRAQAAGLLKEDIIREVARINNMSRKEVRALFTKAAITARRYDDRGYRAAGFEPIPIMQSPEMLNILNAGISKRLGSLQRLTGTIAINTEMKFNELLNVGYNKVVSGAISYTKAIETAVDDLTREGVKTFSYATGREISVESAVRMNILTGVNQTAAQISSQTMKELGISLVITSAHLGARTHPDKNFKDHESWQGKIFHWKELENESGFGKNSNKPLQTDDENDKLLLPDIQVGKSLGAAAKNYEILLPNGEYTKLTEDTKITNIEVMAGSGKNRQIDIIDKLLDDYGGSTDKWQYVKGIGYVDYKGESYKAELHWFQEPSAGKHDWKVKIDYGGNWFIGN